MTAESLKWNPIKRAMACAVSATLVLGIAPAFAAPAAYAANDADSTGLVAGTGSAVTGEGDDADAAKYIAVKDMKPDAVYTTEGTWVTDEDDLFNVDKMFSRGVSITVDEEGVYSITVASYKVKYSSNTYVVNSIAVIKPNNQLNTQDEGGTGNPNVKEGEKFIIKTNSLEDIRVTVKISQEGKTTSTAHDATLALNLDTIYNENQVATGFIDVTPDHWVVTEGWLSQAVDQGLMNGYKNDKGVSTGKFGPDNTITRGQFITILYRDAHEDDSATLDEDKYEKNTTDFTDNEDEKFYTAAINWAAEEEIVTGDKDEDGNAKHTVRPDDPISRQEMATMLFRYNGDEEAATTQNYKDAPDADDVADWAVKGIAWCYDNKVMTGNRDTKALGPANAATRAETAKMAVVATEVIKENAEKKAEEEEKDKGKEEGTDEESGDEELK